MVISKGAEMVSMKDIQTLALKNGAGEWAVKKWVVRKRVPLEWQVKLMKAEPGFLSFSDFERIHSEIEKTRGSK